MGEHLLKRGMVDTEMTKNTKKRPCFRDATNITRFGSLLIHFRFSLEMALPGADDVVSNQR